MNKFHASDLPECLGAVTRLSIAFQHMYQLPFITFPCRSGMSERSFALHRYWKISSEMVLLYIHSDDVVNGAALDEIIESIIQVEVLVCMSNNHPGSTFTASADPLHRPPFSFQAPLIPPSAPLSLPYTHNPRRAYHSSRPQRQRHSRVDPSPRRF